jgi:hypothetical protein
VTVIDPRHPLYGATFGLIQIEDRADRGGQCCLIERDWGQNSYIPLDVTDKSETRWVSSSIPLSIEAIRQLVSIYTRLTEDDQNDSTHLIPKTTHSHSSQRGLEPLDSHAESTSASDTDTNLPESRSKHYGGGGKA